MKAAVRTTYGLPDVVHIEDVEKPAVATDEVLVKVHVTTVNRTDCGFLSGKPFIVRFISGFPKPRAKVLGTEFAGVVETVGSGVTSFKPGDDVFGYSEGRFGAHAEYLTIPADGSIALMPSNMSYEQVAPSTEGSHYALSLIRRANVQSGMQVLVYGATGAIGSSAVQLLKHMGADVTGVCAGEHADLVRGLGADRVIDYGVEDYTKDDNTYDVVLDAVGKSSFGRCKRVLKPRGIYLSSDLGPLNMNPILALVTPLFRGKRVMFPIPPKFTRELANHFRQLLESGAFKPVVDRSYPLDRIEDAFRFVETGEKIGNVLINVV